VKGDFQHIGKKLMASMLEFGRFKVIDLGTDV
jgi:methanogenic corrinoid protein MtbC1